MDIKKSISFHKPVCKFLQMCTWQSQKTTLHGSFKHLCGSLKRATLMDLFRIYTTSWDSDDSNLMNTVTLYSVNIHYAK